MAQLAEVLVPLIRCTDIAGWFDNEVLGVILPHTAGQEAWNLVRRAREQLDQRLEDAEAAEAISYRVHAYPLYDEPPHRTSCRQLSLFDRYSDLE
ncbi:MAG: hypothetical protein ACYS1C_12000 [Planctomycetota bacterium]|jgi:hypothetical protein